MRTRTRREAHEGAKGRPASSGNVALFQGGRMGWIMLICLPNHEASAKNTEMLFGKQLGDGRRHKKAKQTNKQKAKPKQFDNRGT